MHDFSEDTVLSTQKKQQDEEEVENGKHDSCTNGVCDEVAKAQNIEKDLITIFENMSKAEKQRVLERFKQ